ncbi:MAG: DUF1330 domain-containing protein [Woeseiaceae bacterium]|nr:DUF1330 domain-containing protein [Woeseiaceae bacterium]
MGAFMIIQADITDPDRFVEYARRTPALIEQFGGRYRSMRGELEQLEGKPDNRKLVVSEWPSMEAARAFWHSPEYAAVRQYREGTGEFDVYLVEITND